MPLTAVAQLFYPPKKNAQDTDELQRFFFLHGLPVLSNLFGSPTLATRVYSSLMLAILLANGHFESNPQKKDSAENGVNMLIRELEDGDSDLALGPFATEMAQMAASRSSLTKIHNCIDQWDPVCPNFGFYS